MISHSATCLEKLFTCYVLQHLGDVRSLQGSFETQFIIEEKGNAKTIMFSLVHSDLVWWIQE